MSKRLNKRQQREQDELAELEFAKAKLSVADNVRNVDVDHKDDEDEHEQGEEQSKPSNLFAALNLGDDGGEDDDNAEESDDKADQSTTTTHTSKSKKKKKKKKKTAVAPVIGDEETLAPAASRANEAATPSSTKKSKKKGDAGEEEDELDRALRELANKYPNASGQVSAGTEEVPLAGSYAARLRSLLSVDPKNLDPEVELKRFFGSKVIASATAASNTSAQSRNQAAWTRHQAAKIAKLRTTLVKPRVTWPLEGGTHGLAMREMSAEEVEERRRRHGESSGGEEGKGKGKAVEKWYTFEHDGGYRQVQLQFLGAVRSHDPNQLQALLSVYSWHVDTLLQMSEVYRQQGDVGTASDFCDRALFAFDRCLIPGFSLNGSCRLDFDRVENRPLFMALHRDVSHLVRRGLWSTAFSYAKVLLSLDPHDDPHGALLWLDFLAVKSNNLDWLFEAEGALDIDGMPGMAYAKALAARLQEKKTQDHTKSNELLQRAILDYPEVVPILADKAGLNIPGSILSSPYFEMQVAYSEDPIVWMHLLAHIYANRSAPLWKEAENAAWFSEQLTVLESSGKIPSGGPPTAPLSSRRICGLEDTPLWLVRHAHLSESYMGFIPPRVASRLGHAFDPIPPATATTIYDNEYFHPSSGRRVPGLQGDPSGSDQGAYISGVVARLAQLVGGGQNIPQVVVQRLRDLVAHDARNGDGRAMLEVQQLEDILALAEATEDMPGAFPGAGDEDWDDESEEEH